MRKIISLAEQNSDLKSATADLIADAGGQDKAAERCRVSGTQLQRYASDTAQHSNCFMPLDVVLRLENKAKHPFVTEYLAKAAGAVLVTVPQVPAGAVDLLQLLAAQSKESSDLTAAICVALADGTINSAEARRAIDEIDQLVRVAMQMRAELALIVGAE